MFANISLLLIHTHKLNGVGRKRGPFLQQLCVPPYWNPLHSDSAMASSILHFSGQICKMEFSQTASPTRGTFELAIPDHGLAMGVHL